MRNGISNSRLIITSIGLPVLVVGSISIAGLGLVFAYLTMKLTDGDDPTESMLATIIMYLVGIAMQWTVIGMLVS